MNNKPIRMALVRSIVLRKTPVSRYWLAFALVFTIGLIMACLVGAYQQIFKRCLFWTCVPDRFFTVYDLSLPMNLFPEGAIGGAMMTPSELDLALENTSVNVFWANGNGKAVYIVWRFGSINYATDFLNTMPYTFPDSNENRALYRSEIADQFTPSCGLSRFGGYRCNLLARYEEFVIFFEVIIDDQMSVEQFERIVIFIDEQMASYLVEPP